MREARIHSLGHIYEQNQITAFFGNRNATIEAVSQAFPDYKTSSLRQTHSDLAIEAPFEGQPEGDAQYTRERKLALCIRTADCLPVLVHEPETGIISAIHAGWRGVENEIIRKTGRRLIALTDSRAGLSKAHAWIGPHIGSGSFEVGRDVAAKLETSFESVRGWSNATTILRDHPDPAKVYVDLLAIARAQLGSIGIEAERISVIGIDTVQSNDHISFRRDRDTLGRQVSFIALK